VIENIEAKRSARHGYDDETKLLMTNRS